MTHCRYISVWPSVIGGDEEIRRIPVSIGDRNRRNESRRVTRRPQARQTHITICKENQQIPILKLQTNHTNLIDSIPL
jgi:hypothetical protein